MKKMHNVFKIKGVYCLYIPHQIIDKNEWRGIADLKIYGGHRVDNLRLYVYTVNDDGDNLTIMPLKEDASEIIYRDTLSTTNRDVIVMSRDIIISFDYLSLDIIPKARVPLINMRTVDGFIDDHNMNTLNQMTIEELQNIRIDVKMKLKEVKEQIPDTTFVYNYVNGEYISTLGALDKLYDDYDVAGFINDHLYIMPNSSDKKEKSSDDVTDSQNTEKNPENAKGECKMKLKEMRKYLDPDSYVYDKDGDYINKLGNMTSSFDDCEVCSLYGGAFIDISNPSREKTTSEEKSSTKIKLIKPWVKFLDPIDGKKILERIERCGRICWQSEPKGNPEGFVRNLIKKGHTSVLEHVNITFEVMTDIGTMINWIRHRHASYSVESTRFVKYTDGMEFIEPIDISDEEQMQHFLKACEVTAEEYQWMLDHGMKSDQGRTIVNKSLRCNFVCTMNLRSLRNFFQLRCAKDVNAHFKQITIPMLMHLKNKIPVVFDDITYDEKFYHEHIEGHESEYISEETKLPDHVYELPQTPEPHKWYQVTLDWNGDTKIMVQEVKVDQQIHSMDSAGFLKQRTLTSVSCIIHAENEEDAKRIGFRYLYLNTEKTGVKLFNIHNKPMFLVHTNTPNRLLHAFSDNNIIFLQLEDFTPAKIDPNIGLFDIDESEKESKIRCAVKINITPFNTYVF